MSNSQGTVQVARDFSDSSIEGVARPEPPADLWEQIDSALRDIDLAERPANSFTASEFASHKKLSKANAYYQLGRLKAAGRLRKVGFKYYVLVKPRG